MPIVAPVSEGPSRSLIAATLKKCDMMGLIDRTDIICWADSCIEAIDVPPTWLIELSLSHEMHIVDVAKLLDNFGADVDAERVCRCIYAFIAEPVDETYAGLARFAGRLYDVTRGCLGPDWTQELLCEADQLHDNVILSQDRTYHSTERELASQSRQFLRINRDCSVRELLLSLRS
jgi:hypothetical protein